MALFISGNLEVRGSLISAGFHYIHSLRLQILILNYFFLYDVNEREDLLLGYNKVFAKPLNLPRTVTFTS